jgi:hypothetical protein
VAGLVLLDPGHEDVMSMPDLTPEQLDAFSAIRDVLAKVA